MFDVIVTVCAEDVDGEPKISMDAVISLGEGVPPAVIHSAPEALRKSAADIERRLAGDDYQIEVMP